MTKEAGVFDATSKGLGVTVLDANQDLWPDLFLANDTQPNRLYLNTGKAPLRRRELCRESPTASWALRAPEWVWLRQTMTDRVFPAF